MFVQRSKVLLCTSRFINQNTINPECKQQKVSSSKYKHNRLLSSFHFTHTQMTQVAIRRAAYNKWVFSVDAFHLYYIPFLLERFVLKIV